VLDKQINAYLILPDKIREVSSPLFSSWLNDGIFRPDMEASNTMSRMERILTPNVEVGEVLRLILDMKNMASYSI